MAGTANSGGHNKLSTQAHLVKGTFRGDRHADHVTPEPPRGIPEPPQALEGLAAAEWARMVERLTVSGTLSKVDDAAIYQYAQLFAECEAKALRAGEYGEAVQRLEENLSDLEGAELVSCFQEIVKLHTLREQCESKVLAMRMGIRQWLVEFGMTPSARGRVKLPPQKPQSKVDQFRSAKAGV